MRKTWQIVFDSGYGWVIFDKFSTKKLAETYYNEHIENMEEINAFIQVA